MAGLSEEEKARLKAALDRAAKLTENFDKEFGGAYETEESSQKPMKEAREKAKRQKKPRYDFQPPINKHTRKLLKEVDD
jgi:uncharacterized protein YggE